MEKPMSDKSIRKQVEDGVETGLSRALGGEVTADGTGTATGTDGDADDAEAALVAEIVAGRVPASAYDGDAADLEAAIQEHDDLDAEDELVAAEAARSANPSNYRLGIAGETDDGDTTPSNPTEAIALANDTSTDTGSPDVDEYDAGVSSEGGGSGDFRGALDTGTDDAAEYDAGTGGE
jgi:hypothetical protein